MLGALCPLYAPSGKIFVPEVSTLLRLMAFSISTFLLLLSEILRGPEFTLGGSTPPGRRLAEKFFTQSEYFTMSNSVFNYNILPLAVSEILGVPNLR